MDNIFIESMIWEHEILCDIDSYFIEMNESIIREDEYIFEDASAKGEGLFAKIGNLIKKLLDGIKKFFTGKSNEKTDGKVDAMENELRNNPKLKDKKSKIIDPRKVRKLTKEDFKKGAKVVLPCIISAGIATAIGFYRNRTTRIEAQKLEGEVNKIKKDLEAKQTKLTSAEIKTRNEIDKNNKMLKTVQTVSKISSNRREENDNLKEEIIKLSDELSVKNQQLDLLKQSQKQIEDLATGGSSSAETSSDSSNNDSGKEAIEFKELHKKISSIVNSYKTIYKTAKVDIDEGTLISRTKSLFKKTIFKNTIDANGIDMKSMRTGDLNAMLKRWERIYDDVKYIKSKNVSTTAINTAIENYNKSYNRKDSSDKSK